MSAQDTTVQAPVQRTGDSPPSDAASSSSSTVLSASIEAVLFSADRVVSSGKLIEALAAIGEEGVEPETIESAVDGLNTVYETTGRAFRVERVAGGFRVMTRPEHAKVVASVLRVGAAQRLSRPAIETLAVVAYKQPITRADIEAIRGVACGEVLKSLLERRLVEITGRAEEPGRPMLYGTTKRFLDTFGLSSPKELPAVERAVAGEAS